MKSIANRYINELEKTPAQLAEENRRFFRSLQKHSKAIIFGVLSIVLYTFLYEYSGTLIEIAQETHAGHKTLFFVPIVIAFVFSVVHGSFTSHFWDSLGVKAKSK